MVVLRPGQEVTRMSSELTVGKNWLDIKYPNTLNSQIASPKLWLERCFVGTGRKGKSSHKPIRNGRTGRNAMAF